MKYVNYSIQLVLGIIFLILSSLLGLYLPLLLRNIIDNKSSMTFDTFIFVILIFFIQAILISLGQYLMALSGEDLVAETRENIVNRLIRSPLTFFDSKKSGDLASRIVNDSNTLRQFTVETLPTLVTSIVTLVGTLIILLRLDWKLSLAFLVTFPLLFLVITPLSSYSEKNSENLQKHISQLTGALTENFKEIILIKSNVAEKSISSRNANNIGKIKSIAIKTDLIEAISSPFVLFLLFGSIAIIFTYGGQRVSNGELTIGTLISFLIYLFQLLNPVGAVANSFNAFARVKGATSKLETLLQSDQENFQLGLQDRLVGDIVFDNVSFSYGDQLVIDNINLHIKKGETVAFVGPSGSGKTTLIYLLMRFYPLRLGKILINNIDIQEYNLKSLRKQIGFVSQHTSLLYGTIRENLLFGLEEEPSEVQIKEALAAADFEKELIKFKDGLDTYIGEGGKLLSGGQKQRLQIARAYLKNPNYLIFDEATSNLDADTEYIVGQGIKKLQQGKTTIIIAHRLSTVVNADVIYFVDEHKITGSGTHKELMVTHSAYARFVKEQML